jgi:hypothetical protein
MPRPHQAGTFRGVRMNFALDGHRLTPKGIYTPTLYTPSTQDRRALLRPRPNPLRDPAILPP